MQFKFQTVKGPVLFVTLLILISTKTESRQSAYLLVKLSEVCLLKKDVNLQIGLKCATFALMVATLPRIVRESTSAITAN